MVWLVLSVVSGVAVLLLGGLIGYGLAAKQYESLHSEAKVARELLTGRERTDHTLPYLIANIQKVIRDGSDLTRQRIRERLEEILGRDPGPYWKQPEEMT